MPLSFAFLSFAVFVANVAAGPAGGYPIPVTPGRDPGGNQAWPGRRARSGRRRALKSLRGGISADEGEKLLG
jgi:hypothetical protein